ncbi:MAG: hypothetical protein L0Y42_14000 [Phycisphaerales bacterium]|nr:hypothetical protein [Phycisphaerales bacterium]
MSRDDLQTLLWVGGIALALLAAQLNPFTPIALAVVAVFAFIVLRSRMFQFRGCSEFVGLQIADSGLVLTRRNGRRQIGAWKLFERAIVERLPPSTSPMSGERYRLTIANAYKPAIGSFLHTQASEMIVFYFPIVVELDSPAEQVDRFVAQLQDRIRVAQEQAPKRFKAPAVAPDPSALLRLHECMECNYPLRGLAADGRCPECGWRFDHHMFRIEGRNIPRAVNVGLAVAVTAILVGMSAAVNSLALALIALLAGGVALATQYWFRNRDPQNTFRQRVLIRAHGVEFWRAGSLVSAQAWKEIPELRSVWTQQGRWRLTAWSQPKWTVRYSDFFDRWRVSPPGGLLFDVVLDGPREAAEIVCREVQRRWEAERTVPPTLQPVRI